MIQTWMDQAGQIVEEMMLEVEGHRIPESNKLRHTIQMIDVTHSTTEAMCVRRGDHPVNICIHQNSIRTEVGTKHRTILPKAFELLETTTTSRLLTTKSNTHQVEVMILNHLTTKVNLEVQPTVLPRNVPTMTTKSNNHQVEVMTLNQRTPSVAVLCNCHTPLLDF